MPDDNDDLQSRLASVPGVERAFLDSATGQACLLIRPDADSADVLRSAAAAAGPDLLITLALPHDGRERQRVRFVGLRREELFDQQIAIHATLEWDGVEHVGAAQGERGGPIEMRTAAAATLQAITDFIPADIPLRLAGVKQVRAFDAELVVVSVYRTGLRPHNYVGAVVTGDDPLRAAAIAVLSALNRVLGNFLVRG